MKPEAESRSARHLFRVSLLVFLTAGLMGSFATLGRKNRGAQVQQSQRPLQQDQRKEGVIVQADLLPGARRAARRAIDAEMEGPDDFVPPPSRKHRQPRSDEGADPNDDPRGPHGGVATPRAQVFNPVTETAIKLGNDPQVAVGHDYVIASEAHTIVFFDRKGKELPAKLWGTGRALITRWKATEFFAPLLDPFERDSNGNFVFSKPNPNDVNRQLFPAVPVPGQSPIICVPDQPTAPGCISEAYDTRVLYDHEHHRFWIQSALRNQVWGSNSSECNKHVCLSMDTGIPRRLIAVAVSLTEDPRDGFHEFVLVDEYGDWPRMAVHGPFLVLSHNDKQNVYLFDARKLLKGNLNHGLVSLGTYSKSDFDVENIYPVLQYDKEDETSNKAATIKTLPGGSESDKVPTFLVGTKDKTVKIYAFDETINDQPIGGPISINPKLMEVSVQLDDDVDVLSAPQIYRHGKIYLIGDQCVEGSGKECKRAIRLIRIPVFRGTAIWEGRIVASHSASDGFMDTTIGDAFNFVSYAVPALNVNKNGDMLIVYGRAGCCSYPFAPSAEYTIFYHNESSERYSVPLQEAVCHRSDKSDCRSDGHYPDHIDLAAVAIDPIDDATMWMTHAFRDGALTDPKKMYRMVIGKLKP